MSIAEKLTTIAENEQRVYEAGKDAERKAFWEIYQSREDGSPRTTYTNAFNGLGWTDENYNPIREITAHAASDTMYANSYITDTKVPVSIASTSYGNKLNTFANAANLVTVRKFVVNEIQRMNAQFTDCASLKNLTIDGVIGTNAYFQWCPLTPESMVSVITHLQNFAGTSSAYSTTLQFSDDCWAALEAHSTAPDGGTWKDYVDGLGWNI